MKQQLVTMFELQEAMNAKVHNDWRSQDFAWYRAIWVECAELLDHYGWKWWKKQQPDVEQIKLELVDIWHFGLSLLLLKNNSADELAKQVADDLQSAGDCVDFRDELENFTLGTLATRDFDALAFGRLMKGVELSFQELYTSYVGKNVLNFFRQDNGYKLGTYSKVWGDKEDNEHLVEIVNQLDSGSADFKDELYAQMRDRYQRLCVSG